MDLVRERGQTGGFVAELETEPIGGAMPLRAAITPAMNVEATAPMPGVSTPSLPVAGGICRAVMKVIVRNACAISVTVK